MDKKDDYQKIIEELRKNTQYLNIIEIEITQLQYKLNKIDKRLSSILRKKRGEKNEKR